MCLLINNKSLLFPHKIDNKNLAQLNFTYPSNFVSLMKFKSACIHLISTLMKHYLNFFLLLFFHGSLLVSNTALSMQSVQIGFITCPNDTVVNANASCNAVVNYSPTLNGIPPPFVIYSFSGATIGSGIGDGSGSTFNLGTTTVTLIAGDASGTDTCDFDITVVDVTPPTLTCPLNTTLNANNLCQAVLGNYTLGATVNLSMTVNSGSSGTTCTDGFLGGAPEPMWAVRVNGLAYTNYPQYGICYTNPPFLQFTQQYNLGNYPSTVQVCFNPYEDDGTGCVPVKSCSVQVCQNFTTPAPGNSLTYTLSIPNNGLNASWGTVTFTLQASAVVPIATDNCGPVTLTQSPPPGTVLGVGTQAVTLIATDPSGNSTPCTFLVNVVDVTPPVITCPPNVTINNTCQHILADYTSSTAVNLNLTVNSSSSGTNCTDGFLGGAPEPMRALRVNGLAYTNYPQYGICYTNTPFLQFSQQYSFGNYPASVQVCFNPFEDDGTGCVPVKSCSVQVCQNFTNPAPGSSVNYSISIPNNGLNASWGAANFTLQAALNGAQASDNCGIASITQIPAPGTVLGPGSHPITLTATDLSGNTASCTFQVLVVSNQSPPTLISGTTNICTGASTTLTVNGGNPGPGGTAQWFTGSCGGTLVGTGSSISVTPPVTTTYFVRYTGPCGTTSCISITVTVNINPGPPIPVVIMNGPIQLCRGGSVTLTSSPGTSILWSTLETTQSIVVTQPGTFRVSDTDLNGCTAYSDTIAVTFDPGNIAPFTPQHGAPYMYGFEDAVPPALFCGMSISNDNYPPDVKQWETSSTAPKSGNNHMAIDANADGISPKDDWFYTAPLNLQAGRLYRLSFWYRGTNVSNTERLEIFSGNSPDVATMMLSSSIYTKTNIQNVAYVLDSTSNFLPAFSGTYYFGFHAYSTANQASLYIDEIRVKEVTVTGLAVASCTTIPSMYDQLFVQPIAGATNYRYKIVGTGGQASYNFEHYRNNGNIDYRLKWAPGVIYGYTYNISVAYYKDGVWSPYGVSCPVTLGPFPSINLRNNPSTVAGPCDYLITDLNDRFFTDSVSGANDYMYKIVEDTPGIGYDYNQTFQRNNANLDYRLLWAYQASPLVERPRFGYSYEVQTRALVGKTGVNFGNRAGEWGNYGASCKLDLSATPPTTSLTSCGITLTSMNDQFFTTVVNGATNYQYEISAPGYLNTVYRNNANTDYRMIWIPNNVAPGGPKYATTYSVRVKAYVGGVWLNYGLACTITTPAAPQANVPALCGVTLGTGQFNATVYALNTVGGLVIPAAAQYAFHIQNVGGVAYNKTFYNFNANNTFNLSRTLVCCGQQNLLPNATYTIKVAYYAGQWSAEGPACTFTTGATVPRYSAFAQEGVESAAGLLSLSVYPNPVGLGEQYSIELQGIEAANQKVQVAIYNMVGEKVYRAEIITKEEAILTIKPEVALAPGVYMAEALVNGTIYRTKFMLK